MLANMACSLIEHKRISTTLAKAKQLRVYVEPLITRSKDDSTHSRRMVFRKLQSKGAVTELFREVAPKVAERPGGYTRILKTGTRQGDAAEMCFIELVDFNEVYSQAKDESKKQKPKRKRRSGGKKAKGQNSVKQEQAGAENKATAPKPETTENPKPKASEGNADKADSGDKTPGENTTSGDADE